MSFRWRLTSANTFIGVVRDRICELRETAAGTEFRVHGPPARADDVHAASAALRAHLSLDRGPRTPAAKWASPQHALKDSVLPAVAVQHLRCAAALPGVRVLTIGSHIEALITFVGSANNNIKRNMQMVEGLCAQFPHNFLGVDAYGSRHFRFPSADDICSLSEDALWELGWGYRAPRIVKLAGQLRELGGATFLTSLATLPDVEAREALCQLCGVGRKVADCILLFGYERDSVVPVDTHCLQLARRYFFPETSKDTSLTTGLYNRIVEEFHKAFGLEHAGWAFMTLFVAELSDFRSRLNSPAICPVAEVGQDGDNDDEQRSAKDMDKVAGAKDGYFGDQPRRRRLLRVGSKDIAHMRGSVHGSTAAVTFSAIPSDDPRSGIRLTNESNGQVSQAAQAGPFKSIELAKHRAASAAVIAAADRSEAMAMSRGKGRSMVSHNGNGRNETEYRTIMRRTVQPRSLNFYDLSPLRKRATSDILLGLSIEQCVSDVAVGAVDITCAIPSAPTAPRTRRACRLAAEAENAKIGSHSKVRPADRQPRKSVSKRKRNSPAAPVSSKACKYPAVEN